MVILSVSFSRAYELNLLRCSSEWHVRWIHEITLKLPYVGHHQVEVGILLNVAGNIVIVLNEFVD